jgi:hypothetical protein
LQFENVSTFDSGYDVDEVCAELPVFLVDDTAVSLVCWFAALPALRFLDGCDDALVVVEEDAWVACGVPVPPPLEVCSLEPPPFCDDPALASSPNDLREAAFARPFSPLLAPLDCRDGRLVSF